MLQSPQSDTGKCIELQASSQYEGVVHESLAGAGLKIPCTIKKPIDIPGLRC